LPIQIPRLGRGLFDGPAPAPAVTYSTTFSATESPISEGGAWTHNGTFWTKVDTSGGLAFNTQDNSGAVDDSYAYLSGFPPNQSASMVIHKGSPSGFHECEILLRWLDSSSTARGYECNLAWDGGYAEIVRWEGPAGLGTSGSYTYVAPQGSGGGVTVNDGDVFSAQIVGGVITSYLNGVPLNTATDSTWTTGNPGIGFYRASAGPATDYCATSYSATGL
jgi:hypothetical protein